MNSLRLQEVNLAVLVVCLFAVARTQYCTPPSCGAPVSSYAWYGGDSATGPYVTVGGVFAVHERGTGREQCGDVREDGIQSIEAFLWAVRTFQKRYPSVSAQFNIRAVAVDSCGDTNRAVQQVLNIEHCQVAVGVPPVSPGHLLAFVGADTTEQATALAPELARLRKTLVCPAASGAFLNDVSKYPYFLRTVPSDAEQAKAIVALLLLQGWRHVQVVLQEGEGVGEEFLTAAERSGICIVQTHITKKVYAATDMSDIIDKLTTTQETRIVVVLLPERDVNQLLRAAIHTRGMFTWVGSNSWGTSMSAVEGVKNIAEGAVIVALRSNNDMESVYKFKSYFEARKPDTNAYNPWMTAFWEKRFGCSVDGRIGAQTCKTDIQSLEGFALDTSVPYTIKAVDAILHGIARARSNVCPTTSDGLCTAFVNDVNKWTVIHDKIRSVNLASVVKFNVTSGETLDTRHVIYNFRAAHDNCNTHCYVQVRSYHSYTGMAN